MNVEERQRESNLPGYELEGPLAQNGSSRALVRGASNGLSSLHRRAGAGPEEVRHPEERLKIECGRC